MVDTSKSHKVSQLCATYKVTPRFFPIFILEEFDGMWTKRHKLPKN